MSTIKELLNRTRKEEKIAPQVRTEIHHEQIELQSKDAIEYAIAFDYRYYTEPIVTMGISSTSYQSEDGSTYKTHFVATVKEFLQDPNSKLYVGVKLFVRAMTLPNKLQYPIVGELPIVVMGKGTSRYMGALETAIPVVPQNGTTNDNDKDLENEPPPAVQGLTLETGTYVPSNGKGQTAMAYIKASWQPVVHNDLQGYESDISENDNQHYDGKPDPKFNSKTNMVWMGLDLNKTYYVRVRAVDWAGNYSDWVETSITTPDSLGTVNPPTNINVQSQPPQGILVTWQASTSLNVYGYEINRANVSHGATAPSQADSKFIGETGGTFYFDNNLDTSQDYYYWVRAVGTDGRKSEWAGPSSVIQPAMITDLTAEANSLYNSLKQIDSNKLGDNAVTADKIATGALLTYNATIVNRLAENKLTFTVTPSTGNPTLNVNAGTVLLTSYQNGQWTKVSCSINSTSYSMSSGNYYYAYFIPDFDSNGEPTSGTYNLTFSESYPTDEHAVVVITAYAFYSSNMGKYTIDAKAVGSTGTVINGDHIATGSITAQSACVASLDASKITTGTLNTNYLTITGTNIHASNVTEDSGRYWAVTPNADETATHRAADIANLHAQVDHGAGLYATSQYLGYFDSNGYPQAYIQSNGYFYFRGDANNYVAWNGSTLEIQGHLYSSFIEGGTITGAEIQTAQNNNEYIAIDNGGSYTVPEIQFFYNNGGGYQLYHYIYEANGVLNITSTSGSNFGINFAGSNVIFNDGILIGGSSGAILIYDSSSNLLLSSVGIEIGNSRGLSFNHNGSGYPNTDIAFWFNDSLNAFQYKGSDGNTYTIATT